MRCSSINAGRFALLAAALLLSGCDWMQKKDPPGAKTEAQLAAEQQSRLRRACASEATYDRLKELAFDEAARIRGDDARMLDALAGAAVVRMEEPVVKSRDETLNVTVCSGRFVMELPPGAENAFDGERRLTADIEYAAQAALDGSGLVYQMSGAEPIIYRLATIGGLRLAGAAPAAPATPTPAPTPAAEPLPVPERPVARPSFDCRHAGTRSERLVCSDPGLAARDRQMASVYYDRMAQADADTRRRLRRSRDAFLARRERCDSPACVAVAYQQRVDEIRRIAARD